MQRRDGAVSAKGAVAEAFERYYELYEKYGMGYDVTGILNGSVIRGSTLYEEKRPDGSAGSVRRADDGDSAAALRTG